MHSPYTATPYTRTTMRRKDEHRPILGKRVGSYVVRSTEKRTGKGWEGSAAYVRLRDSVHSDFKPDALLGYSRSNHPSAKAATPIQWRAGAGAAPLLSGQRPPGPTTNHHTCTGVAGGRISRVCMLWQLQIFFNYIEKEQDQELS